MYVAVTVPSLDRIVLRGAGNISVSGVDSGRLTVAQRGAGTTATRRLSASITGTGTIAYRGDPRQVTRRVSGSGTISPG